MKRLLRAFWGGLRQALFMARLLVLSVLLFAAAALAYLMESDSASPAVMRAVEDLTQGRIRAEQVRGPLKGPLHVRGFVLEDKHVRVEVSEARLDWSWWALLGARLWVRELEAGEVRLTLKHPPRTVPPKPAVTQLPIAIVLSESRIRSFSLINREGGRPLVFEDLRVAADWTGPFVSIESLHARYAPLGVLDLVGTLRLQEDAIELRGLAIRGFAEIGLDGVIGYNDDSLRAEARWKELHWPPQSTEPLLRSRTGALSLAGTWKRFDYQLKGDLYRDRLSARLGAGGHGSTEGLDVQSLRLQGLEGELTASGQLRWLPELSLSGRGEFRGLDPAALDARWPGRLSGQFSGGLSRLEPLTAQLEVHTRDSQLRGHAFRLDADAKLAGRVLSLAAFNLVSGQSRLSAQGRVAPDLDLDTRLDSPELGELWPGLQGQAQLQLRAKGAYAGPQLAAQLKATGLAYGPARVAEARLDADLHPQAESRFQLDLREAQAGLRVPSLSLRGSGTTARNRFELDTRSAVGTIRMQFEGALDMARRLWRGRLVGGQGEPLQLSPWRLEEPSALELGLDRFLLEPACWTSAPARACLGLRRQGAAAQTAFRVEEFAFAYFEPLLPPGWKLSGKLNGTGVLEHDGQRLRAQTDLSTSAGELRIGGNEAFVFLPSLLKIQETDTGFVSRLNLPLAEGELRWDAVLSPAPRWEQRRWSGELRADLSSLEPLRLFSPELESIRGELKGQFAISGTAGAPRLTGSADIVNARLRLSTPGIELSEAQARLSSDAASGRIGFEASARSGGGSIRLQGETDYASLGQSVNLELSGEDFQVLATTQARVWLSPRLNFRLKDNRADLSGEVQVPRADITPTSFSQGQAPSSDQVIINPDGGTQDRGLIKIHSSVHLSLGEDVRFDGLGLKTRLTGGLTAFDEPGRPTSARGEMVLDGGRYQAYGQDLQIETGRLLFNGGPITSPAVEIRAKRAQLEDTDVTVGLYVRGTLAAPEFSLYSSPAMPQDQQLAWLVLGRPIEESIAGSSTADQNAVSGAALSLGLSGGNFLAQKFQGGLRLDEISLGARPGETADQAKLTIGKYLSPKLYVSYGVGLFQPGHTFRLLYDVGRGFKLSTESGVESAGDLVYTIEK